MFKNFFKKKEKISDNKNILIAALLVHAAKIDNEYTDVEKKIIKEALINLNLVKLDEVDKLLIPTTIIWGKQDSIIPQNHSEKINVKINIKLINECGHMAHTEHPNEVNAIIKDTISK